MHHILILEISLFIIREHTARKYTIRNKLLYFVLFKFIKLVKSTTIKSS